MSKLKELAQATGVDYDKARDLLAEYLPIAIDKATPEGKVPPPDPESSKKVVLLNDRS